MTEDIVDTPLPAEPRTPLDDFEGENLLWHHTLPAMHRAIQRRMNQIFSPKEMAVILGAIAGVFPEPPPDLRGALWDSRRHEMNVDGSACWCDLEPFGTADHEELCLRLRSILAALAIEQLRRRLSRLSEARDE